jgi:hypothetical protein
VHLVLRIFELSSSALAFNANEPDMEIAAAVKKQKDV